MSHRPDLPFPPGDLGELARRGVVRRYARGSILIHEGDVGDSLFVVLQGEVRAYIQADDGREFTLGLYGAGDYIGEMSLDGGERSASVATTQASLCSVVTRAVLTEFLRDRPDFAFDLLARVIRRARRATESLRNLALMDVYGRIARLLEEQARRDGPEGPAWVERLSQQEIANQVGCSRAMVSRIFKDLGAGGFVSVQKERIVLLRRLPAGW